MVETITDGGYFGFFKGTKRVFELGSKDQPLVRIDDIPQRELEKIKNALRNLNLPTTDDKVLELYTEKLNSLRGTDG